MAKTLILHRHSDKTPDGEHISKAGLEKAQAYGNMCYRGKVVNHLFYSPFVRTVETATAMRLDNQAFDAVVMHEPMFGLGSEEAFIVMATAEFKSAVTTGASNLDALSIHKDERYRMFLDEGFQALRAMFAQMGEGELGVGVFHDPLISLIARHLGYSEARSLEEMEAIVFMMNSYGGIKAKPLVD